MHYGEFNLRQGLTWTWIIIITHSKLERRQQIPSMPCKLSQTPKIDIEISCKYLPFTCQQNIAKSTRHYISCVLALGWWMVFNQVKYLLTLSKAKKNKKKLQAEQKFCSFKHSTHFIAIIWKCLWMRNNERANHQSNYSNSHAYACARWKSQSFQIMEKMIHKLTNFSLLKMLIRTFLSYKTCCNFILFSPYNFRKSSFVWF